MPSTALARSAAIVLLAAPVWAESGSGEADEAFDVYTLVAVLFMVGLGLLLLWRVASYLFGCGVAIEEADSARTVVRIEKPCENCV